MRRLHGRPGGLRRPDIDELPRALRGDHRPCAGPGLLRRSERRDRRHLRLADQKARPVPGSARVVESAGQVHLSTKKSPIEHVVIIVKENHGYDNYFGKFPGGNGVALAASPNPPPKDPDHRHAAWLTRDKTAPRLAFPQSEIASYWGYARQFTLCDNYYTDVAGPSTPNHLMLIMADSKLVDNPSTSYRKHPGPPLYDQPSLPSQLDAARLTWGNYNRYAFEFIKYASGKKRTRQQFATDAAAGKLPSVSWLYADDVMSEHPAGTATQRAAGAADVAKGSLSTAKQVQASIAGGF